MKFFCYYALASLLKPLLWILSRINKSFMPSYYKYAAIQRITGYRGRKDDIFLCTYPKSGTTWLQMILFQLNSDGDLKKAGHLSRAIPHFEEQAFDTKQLGSPRIFKTHLLRKQLPKNGRFIYVMRNGMDVVHSYYHHYQVMHLYQGSFEEFFDLFMGGEVAYGGWFDHISDWLRQKENKHILFLSYEEMIDNPRRVIEQIASFCDIPMDPEKMERVLHRTSFDFMKEHKALIDMVSLRKPMGKDVPLNLIREGKTGMGHNALSQSQKDAYQRAFNASLDGFGLQQYKI